MRCPFCLQPDTFVKDSREADHGSIIRRRRYCKVCSGRFTTFERIQLRALLVVKRSGTTKAFDRDKIHKSISTAVRKRHISEDVINQTINKIVSEIENNNSREMSTRKIGELIMQELAKIDLVAYIRFASVYKEFSSAQDFAKFINKIKPVK